MRVKALSSQNLIDIAIQQYGSYEGVVRLAIRNNMSVTDELPSGTVLDAPEDVYNATFQNYVRSRKIRPATGRENGEITLRIFTKQFTLQFT